LTVWWRQAQAGALRTAGVRDGADVTLVNLGAGERRSIGAKRAIPGGGEQGGVRPIAQAMRTLAAHSRRSGGLRDAAGTSEGFEEEELAHGRPSIPPDGWKLFSGLLWDLGPAHWPVSITTSVL
jgi:hypothetical protein